MNTTTTRHTAAHVAGWTIFNWYGYDAKGVAVESPSGALYSAFDQLREQGNPESGRIFKGLERMTNFGAPRFTNARVIAFLEKNWEALAAGVNPASLA